MLSYSFPIPVNKTENYLNSSTLCNCIPIAYLIWEQDFGGYFWRKAQSSPETSKLGDLVLTVLVTVSGKNGLESIG